MITISKSEREQIHKKYPQYKIHRTKNGRYYMPEESFLLRVLASENDQAKQLLESNVDQAGMPRG